MEVDPPVAEGAAQLPVLNLDVLDTVRSAQAVHGLKHSEFSRYRQYCSRRLRRIYKGTKFLHGRGRYQKKKLDPEALKDERSLHIPLVSAERAWAHAMDLKNQIEQGVEGATRHQLVRRLAKAAAHACELVSLTAARCDARSSLEAEAYCAWMGGTLLLEKESDWEGALAAFHRARSLLNELFKVGDFDRRATCRHFLDQVEPAVRFCEYQIGRRGSGGGGAAAPDAAALLQPAAGGGGADVLASKLASLAAEAQAQRAAATSEFEWGGEALAVRDERCRVALHAAQELQTQLQAANAGAGGEEAMGVASGAGAPAAAPAAEVEARVALFDRTINAFSEARAAVRAAAQLGQGGADAEAQRAELAALGRAVHAVELQHTIARNLYLADASAARLARAQRRQLAQVKGKEKGERPARPEDVARLFDTLVANATELNELAAAVGGARGEALMDDCTAKVAHYQAGRCLYVAHTCLASSQLAHAAALFRRAAERCAQAAQKYAECGAPGAAGRRHLAGLAQQAAAFQAVAVAERRAAELREASAAADGFDSLELQPGSGGGQLAGGKRSREEGGGGGGGGGGGYLAESLDEWAAFAGAVCPVPRICRIPPPPPLMPVRPIVLDTALAAIRPPSVAHRVSKRASAAAASASGMVGRLFGWGKAS